MTLCEELYFEITVQGRKSALKKFASFLTSGDLDDFFEISSDYIVYDDEYNEKDDDEDTSFVFSNDDLGIEVEDFNPEDFLDVFCRAGENLDIVGHFYDIDDEEYRFASPVGDSGYLDTANVERFNDELDDEAYNEEKDEREDEND